jgi:hypothetical protein
MDLHMSDNYDEEVIKTKFGTITRRADGSLTATNESARVELDSQGSSTAHVGTVKKVGIDNLVDVESHRIKRDETATSHHLVFIGGGELRFSYRPDGHLLEFRGSGIATQLTNNGILIIGKGS